MPRGRYNAGLVFFKDRHGVIFKTRPAAGRAFEQGIYSPFLKIRGLPEKLKFWERLHG
jgi:hypothetical protein